MKHFAIAAATVAALALTACQKTNEVADPADPGTSNATVNAAQDATSTAVGAASAASAGQMTTDAFVTNTTIGDMYEIQAGEIAQSKGQAAGVKAFGKMKVADHKALANEMKPLIAAAGKTAPAGLDARRKGLIDNLNAAAPADFDRVYLEQQEAAHNEALTLLRGYAERGDDPGLKAAAAKAAPRLEAHLERVRQLKAGEG